MTESENACQQEHKDFLRRVALQVDGLIQSSTNRECFHRQIESFRKKVEAYYRSHRDKQSGRDPRNPINWFPPETFSDHYKPEHQIKMVMPKECEPMRFEMAAKYQRSEDERRMICYVLLAVVHDNSLIDPIYERIWFDPNYKSEVWDPNSWGNTLWKWLSVLSLYGSDIRDERATRIKDEINHVLSQVTCDLSPKEPAETRRDTTPAKKEKEKATINVQISGGVQAENLQIGHDMSIRKQPGTERKNATPTKRRRIWAWLTTHPHSYGLTGGVFFLILFFVLGLFKPEWRQWCWGVAGLAFVVLILSLLGGRSRR